jgi:hypothetical protein
VTIRPSKLGLVLVVIVAAIAGGACGVASIAPVITYSERQFDSMLVGTWLSEEDSAETVVLRAIDSRTRYWMVYTDEDTNVSRMEVDLGRIGRHRVIDVTPGIDPPEGELERELVRYVHGIAVVQELTATRLGVSFLEPDSLKAALRRQPTLTPHYLDSDNVLLTGSTEEVNQFLRLYLDRPGTLTEPGYFVRKKP